MSEPNIPDEPHLSFTDRWVLKRFIKKLDKVNKIIDETEEKHYQNIREKLEGSIYAITQIIDIEEIPQGSQDKIPVVKETIRLFTTRQLIQLHFGAATYLKKLHGHIK